MRRVLAVIAFAGLACSDTTAPGLPADAHQLVPVPIQYATWWRMTEACSGLSGDMSRVHFYTTFETIHIGARDYDGYWFPDDNRIALAGSAMYNGGIVRHEMLHALLRGGSHPPEYFVGRCGPLAPCGLACDTDETHLGVPESARVVPSESLQVSITLAPSSAPSMSIDSGWTTVLVTATNTRVEPVWVNTADNVGFGYVLARTPGTFRYTYGSRMAFRAGESRSIAFDFQLQPAGFSDTLRGFFHWHYSPPLAVTVAP